MEWIESRNATSSPVVWEGECYFSHRHEVEAKTRLKGPCTQTEHLARGRSTRQRTAIIRDVCKADYLDHAKRYEWLANLPSQRTTGLGRWLQPIQGRRQDVPGYEKPRQGTRPCHLGLSRVQAICLESPTLCGARRHCQLGRSPVGSGVLEEDGWTAARRRQRLLDSPLTPPAIANGKLFFGSVTGEIHCLSTDLCEELWSVSIGEPVVFQPAVAGGRIYVGTDSGSLICLEPATRTTTAGSCGGPTHPTTAGSTDTILAIRSAVGDMSRRSSKLTR